MILVVDARCAPLATNATPDFKEVYQLIRTHLPGATDDELDRAAVQGLLTGLNGRVALSGEQEPSATNSSLIGGSRLFDNGVGYVRVRRVKHGLASEVSNGLEEMTSTNQLKGLVIDLRFARGSDYAAAAATADLFVAQERPLLEWSNETARATSKTNAVTLPVAVLVNKATSGAAEALAAVLRETGAGLILGSRTAGQAMVMQEFPLSDGQRLRIATQTVKLGDGQALTSEGVKPDIEVDVSVNAERKYLEDPYAEVARTNIPIGNVFASDGEGTNAAVQHPRLSEADLVREKREGISPDEDAQLSRSSEPEKPVIRDPVLARAVDLIKALAVVRASRF